MHTIESTETTRVARRASCAGQERVVEGHGRTGAPQVGVRSLDGSVCQPFGQVRGPIEPGEVVEAVVTSFQPAIVPWEAFAVKVQELVAR